MNRGARGRTGQQYSLRKEVFMTNSPWIVESKSFPSPEFIAFTVLCSIMKTAHRYD